MTARPAAPRSILALAPLLLASGLACAATVTYDIDPEHTYPSFEADHLGGLSVWRGKFNRSSGKVTLDRAAGTGTVEVEIDAASIDFGNDALSEHARGPDLFDVGKYPTARYAGRLEGFAEGKPTRVVGELTLHGVTRPVELQVKSFKCMPHPVLKRELCGADALATIQRDEFGMPAGKDYGFGMAVTLRIQVEAIAQEAAGK
ncbi:MAG TPA: YceI family protein [Luteimonas sp.]|nr:YceI family protein [Luteimonas sp.]